MYGVLCVYVGVCRCVCDLVHMPLVCVYTLSELWGKYKHELIP